VDDLCFDIPTLIEYCSTFTQLEAGDVIVTGTTGGVGAYQKPPLWMKPGDTIEVEISNVGVLRNPDCPGGVARHMPGAPRIVHRQPARCAADFRCDGGAPGRRGV